MIRVYEYGCLSPIEGLPIAIEQMRRRNRLWNALVEIEQKHREQAAKLLSDEPEQQEIESLIAKLADLRQEIKNHRKMARSKKVAIDDLRGLIVNTKETLSTRIEQAKAARRERVARKKEQLSELNRARYSEQKRAQAEAGLYWCNYDEVIANYEDARRRPGTLRFHSFRGNGKVTVRYQNGLPAGAAFADDTRFQIRSLSDEEIKATGRKNPKARHIVSLRIGSTGRAPVWFRLPVVLHRDIPDDATIRSASIKQEVVGGRARHKLLVTVDDGKDAPVSKVDGECAIDVGWRVVPAGLRVACWVDKDGNKGEVVLNQSVLWEFERVRTLQSTIDTKFEEIKNYLAERRGELPVTDELRTELSSVNQWRSPGRLIVWLRKAREAGFTDEYLEAWRIKHWHLYSWASNLLDQVIRRRLHLYREFASWLSKNYGRVLMEKFNISEVAKKPNPESGTAPDIGARYRQIASVSEFRSCVNNAMAREGGVVDLVQAQYTTQRCHGCGSMAPWDAASSLIHRCESCQAVWDQDENACLNMLSGFADWTALATSA